MYYYWIFRVPESLKFGVWSIYKIRKTGKMGKVFHKTDSMRAKFFEAYLHDSNLKPLVKFNRNFLWLTVIVCSFDLEFDS